MSDRPWLSIVGIGEDGLVGLPDASRAALAGAEIIIGAPRHLALVAPLGRPVRDWPVPFSLEPVLALRGRRVAMLASGDPFWFGAGGALAAHLAPEEWRAWPAPSTFSLTAARLGWRIEAVSCLGLHAAPLTQLRPHLAPGQRIIVLLRNGAAVRDLAGWLVELGFGPSRLWVLERLGGAQERVRSATAETCAFADIAAPVAVALEVAGPGRAIPRASGLPDDFFEHDGQITKRPVRALTLSALAPRPGEVLWDIGAGSGAVSIEWLLAHPTTQAVVIEADPARTARLRANADRLGVDRLILRQGRAPEALADLPAPDAVFIGGGASAALLETLWTKLAPGTRIVANAVTLETEALLLAWQARVGGALLRIELAQAEPLGRKQGWRAQRPVVQWSVTR